MSPDDLSADARGEAQRILDRAARRLLAARLDGDAVVAAAGGDGDALDAARMRARRSSRVRTSQSPAVTVTARGRGGL